jgi:DNA-binding MarR family transcriptional regulator
MAANFRQSLNDKDKVELRKLLSALEHFRAIKPTLPIQYIVAYLLVALDEGNGPTELGAKSGVSQSVMSRHLLDIGERNRHMEPGLGLIHTRPDPMELRRHQAFLSDVGKALAHKLIRAIRD